MHLETITTETWQIALPSDWVAKEDGGDGQYEFESPDGAKGITIGTWRVAEGGLRRSSCDVAQSFRATVLTSLRAMAGYDWQILVDEVVEMGVVSIAISDAWDSAQCYRITGGIL